MGSCISKCKPKKKFKEDECRHVHDKLVISQDPPIISPVVAATDITRIPSDKPLSPAPSTSSTASFSSFSCSTNTKYAMASSISSSSSLSSSSSSYYSTALMKDRSFSNDFLWSCVKENPHVVGLNEKSSSVEKTVLPYNKIHSRNLDPSSLIATKTRQNVQEKSTINAGSTPKKRARASSPTLVRQKSFRKEQNLVPNRGLRSPSPSRRFNGESNRIFPVKESSSYRKPVVFKGNAVSSTPKRESFRAPIQSPSPSPSRELTMISRDYAVRKSNEALSQRICSRIDGGVGVGDGKEIDIVMEDINNPLIALDCFIFL